MTQQDKERISQMSKNITKSNPNCLKGNYPALPEFIGIDPATGKDSQRSYGVGGHYEGDKFIIDEISLIG